MESVYHGHLFLARKSLFTFPHGQAKIKEMTTAEKEKFPMKMNEHALQMLRELTDAPGASGFEDEVVTVAR